MTVTTSAAIVALERASARHGPPRCRRSRRHCSSRGFSLLEVILALTILVGAIAVLGELVRLGMVSAAGARDLTQAQLLCESKMSEILAKISPPDPVQGVPFDLDPDWVYSLQLEPVDAPGIMALRVTVSQNLSAEQRPAEFSLVRLIQDPGIELPTEAETAPTSATSTSATSTATGGAP